MTTYRMALWILTIVASWCVAPCVRADFQSLGVKFYVLKSQKPGTVPLRRLLLSSGMHCYTTDDREVERLTAREGARDEGLLGYVYSEAIPGTVRLYRLRLGAEKADIRHFYTAFEPEKRDVIRRRDLPVRLHGMTCYVYPHDFSVEPDNTDIVAVHGLYNPNNNEFFYTSSTDERDALLAKAQRQREEAERLRQQQRDELAARFMKLRGVAPFAAGLREEAVLVGNIEWTVLRVQRLGNTLKNENEFIGDAVAGGEFISVEFRVENKGKSPETLLAPRLFDADGREFARSTEADWHVPAQSRLLLETLNPNVPVTREVIYDIPAGAVGLGLLAEDSEFLNSSEGAIDLGL